MPSIVPDEEKCLQQYLSSHGSDGLQADRMSEPLTAVDANDEVMGRV